MVVCAVKAEKNHDAKNQPIVLRNSNKDKSIPLYFLYLRMRNKHHRCMKHTYCNIIIFLLDKNNNQFHFVDAFLGIYCLVAESFAIFRWNKILYGLPIVLFPPYYRLHHFWKSNLECIKTQGLVDFCISNCRRGKHCFVNLYIFLCEKLGRERCIDGVIVLI